MRCQRSGEEPCLAGFGAPRSSSRTVSAHPVVPVAILCCRNWVCLGQRALCSAPHPIPTLKWSLGPMLKIVCGHLIKDHNLSLHAMGPIMVALETNFNSHVYKLQASESFFFVFNLLALACLYLCIARSSASGHTVPILPNTVASAKSFPLILTPTFLLPSAP